MSSPRQTNIPSAAARLRASVPGKSPWLMSGFSTDTCPARPNKISGWRSPASNKGIATSTAGTTKQAN